MTQHISARLRRLVVRRARNRCEYCGLSQLGQEATFHVDHIVPVNAGGNDTADNLALACVYCSLRKAARHTENSKMAWHPQRLWLGWKKRFDLPRRMAKEVTEEK